MLRQAGIEFGVLREQFERWDNVENFQLCPRVVPNRIRDQFLQVFEIFCLGFLADIVRSLLVVQYALQMHLWRRSTRPFRSQRMKALKNAELPIIPGTPYNLSREKILEIQKKSRDGGAEASKRLWLFYELSARNHAEAAEWLEEQLSKVQRLHSITWRLIFQMKEIFSTIC